MHNQRKNETYKRGLNDDSDMTYEEKKVKRMGVKKPHQSKGTKRISSLRRKRDDQPLPDSISYVSKLTAIKNQGDCGACWAFAANAVLEYQIAVKKNMSVQLSEQELIDCNNYNMSCNGGWPTNAYNYIIQNGLSSRKNYQFLAYSNDCLKNRVKRTTRIIDACERMFVHDIV